MATYTDRLLVLSSSGVPTRIAASDTIELSLGNLVIGGDLTVKGDRIVNQSETVLLADNHTYVNAGYTSTVAQTGGLVVNYLPTATKTLCTGAGVFSAGVDGVSDPSVTTTDSAVFSAGDFIQVSSSLNGQNDGLYEVLSHVGSLLKIRSTLNGAAGGSDQVMDFTDGQFVAATDEAAVITKVNISVLRAGTDGTWESAYGSSTSGFTFLDIASVAGSSLQSAYVSGNTIDANATEGDLAITVDSVDFKVDGSGTAGSVLFGSTTEIDTFEVVATNAIGLGASAGNVSIQADLGVISITTGADYLQLGSATDLDLDGVTVHMDSSGQMDIASGADINMSAVGDLDLDGATVHVDASGQMDVAAGADLNMSAVGDLDLDGATVHVDSSGQMDLASGAALNVDAVGAVSIGAGASSDFTVTGDLDLSASADLDLDGATVHMDSSGQMDIAAGADLNITASNSLTLHGAEEVADAVRIYTVVKGGIDIDAGEEGIAIDSLAGVSIGASGSSDFTVVGDLDLSASLDLDLDGATVHMDSSGQMDIASGAALNVDAVGAVSIGAGASSDFTVTGDLDLSASADLDLDGATVHIDASGQMDITAAADLNMMAVGDLDLDGTTIHMDSGNQIDVYAYTDINMLAIGDLDFDGATVHMDSSGQMDIASGAALNVDAVGALSLGAGASSDFTVTGDLDLSASADLDLDGATVHVDASGQMDLAAGADLNMSAVGNLDLDGASVDIDASGAVSIGAGASSDFTVTGDLDLSASANLDLDGASVDIDASAAFSIDGAAASNVSVTGADLTVSTITSGNLILSSAGDLDFDAVGTVNFASGGNSIEINPGDDSIDVSAQGAFGVAAASAAFVIADNQADAFLVEDAAGVDYIKLDTSDGSEQIIFGNASTNPSFDFAGTGVVSMDALYVSKHAKFEEVAAPSNVADHGFVYVKADGDDSELFFFGDHNGSGKEVQLTKDGFLNVQAIASSEFLADGAISAGDALYIVSATQVGKSDATTADGKNYVVGFAKAGAADGVVVPMAALPGAVVATGSIVGFAAAGAPVYLSETAGVITVTAPTASGSTVYKVGYALSATSILFQPQLIAINP